MSQGQGKALGLRRTRQSNFHAPCGSVYTCDDTDNYWSLYGRSMASDYWGTELAYIDMGRMDRAGGTTRAYGLNVSLIGKLPIAQSLGLFGKVGALYGRTRTSTGTSADITSGNESGFGLSLGAGLSWDFSPTTTSTFRADAIRSIRPASDCNTSSEAVDYSPRYAARTWGSSSILRASPVSVIKPDSMT